MLVGTVDSLWAHACVELEQLLVVLFLYSDPFECMTRPSRCW
jgi:hypothetical protein